MLAYGIDSFEPGMDSERTADKNADRPGDWREMKCRFCNSIALRRSRLRKSDLPRLLLFQYPIRCRGCHMRVHVWMHQAFRLNLAGKAGKRGEEQRPTESKGTAPEST